MKQRQNYGSRLSRIERKCDRIISELRALKNGITRQNEIDTLIDRLHHSAREMRCQCRKERSIVKRIFPRLSQ